MANKEILIRPVREEDARAIWEIYTPFIREGAITFDVEVYPVSEFVKRIRAHTPEHAWMVAVIDEKVVGYANATEHRKKQAYNTTKEVSIYVREEARGHGVARLLFGRLFQELKEQGVNNLLAGITLPNDASVRLHESAGFTLVGTYLRVGFKDGNWQDVSWYEYWLGE
ncbi:MAG: L-amino acid N-acyltransferase YncA [Flavobacteriales bacterium]|jgi:L-amino acid N-acyltransferase YncA